MLTEDVKFLQYEDINVLLKLSIPFLYPENASVTIISLSFHNIKNNVSNDNKLLISNEINMIIERNKGEETLFDVINHLRENSYVTNTNIINTSIIGNFENKNKNDDENENENENENNFMNIAQEIQFDSREKKDWKITSSKMQPIEESSSLRIFHGEITTEKKSRFLSHFAYVNNMEEIKEFRENILNDKKCSTATHNIFAFRFICPVTGTFNFKMCYKSIRLIIFLLNPSAGNKGYLTLH